MLWGDQWVCGCGTHNFAMRKKCRDCGLPRELAVGEETAADVIARGRAKDERQLRGPEKPASGDDAED